MSYSDNSRASLIESLRQSGPDFVLSNVILPNSKSLRAIQELFRLREDMLTFSIDTASTPDLPLPPVEPSYEGLTNEEKTRKYADFQERFSYWILIKDAHNRKVPLDKYLMVEEYFTPYYKTIEATSAIKGARFKAFTKVAQDDGKKKGLLGALMGKSDE